MLWQRFSRQSLIRRQRDIASLGAKQTITSFLRLWGEERHHHAWIEAEGCGKTKAFIGENGWLLLNRKTGKSTSRDCRFWEADVETDNVLLLTNKRKLFLEWGAVLQNRDSHESSCRSINPHKEIKILFFMH